MVHYVLFVTSAGSFFPTSIFYAIGYFMLTQSLGCCNNRLGTLFRGAYPKTARDFDIQCPILESSNATPIGNINVLVVHRHTRKQMI